MTAASGADQPTLRDGKLCDYGHSAEDHEQAGACERPPLHERPFRNQMREVLAQARRDGVVANEMVERLWPLIEADREGAKAEGGAEALEQAADEVRRLRRGLSTERNLRDRAAALRATTGQPPDGGDVR